ncbi:sigma-70 family RNA polymerase sigma factor [Sphingopyxis indica]|uniref:sigma-70 family RNA polymerase sigma factor n=1 Tax=Sphingopyxis indica TaxID=436663 RepID=UPI001BB00FE9|nr:sigma-70 family RNA polymerase sigma factor [Sphingopyxis indica]
MSLQISLFAREDAPACDAPAAPAPLCDSDDLDALMARVARGDADAFGALVDRYSARLYRLAWRLLGDAQEAEDAVQDCFARLWQGAPGWQARGGGLATWLHRVTVNRCLDRLRRYRTVADEEAVAAVEDISPGPERRLAMHRLQNAIEAALHALPHRHRAALVLCYLEGFSNALAAEMLGLNLKAMESLLFRARRSLRERLEQMGVAVEDLELLA